MNDGFAQYAPSKMTPVLIGAGAMTASAVIPFLSMVNCLCCAGLMGGAVLGVWFYKKSFPADMPFTVGNGAIIGTLSGLVAAPLTAIIEAVSLGAFTSDFSSTFELQMHEAMQNMEMSGQDPATAEQVRQLLESFMTSPALVFASLFVLTLLVFVAFGALGGVIGGNIFKTRVTQVPPQRPGAIS